MDSAQNFREYHELQLAHEEKARNAETLEAKEFHYGMARVNEIRKGYYA